MVRSVKEWIGKNDDTPVPAHVKLRVWERGSWDGRKPFCCQGCGRLLLDAKICDHVVAIINGGQNRESNLQTLGAKCCNPKKTAGDVKTKSETYRTKASHHGFKKPKGAPMLGSRASGWKHTMSHGWVRR